MPIEFRVVQRTEQEWIRLRSALVVERRARRTGEIMDLGPFATVANARTEPQVKRAIGILAGPYFTEIRGAFRDAVESVGA